MISGISKLSSSNRNNWLNGFSLYLITLCAQFSNIAYQIVSAGEDFLPVVLPSVIFLTLITLPSILIGFRFGPALGLSLINCKVLIQSLLREGVTFSLVVATLLGGLLLFIRWFVAEQLPSELPAYGFRGPIGGLLVSVGAGIGEEVWFRFGLMTLMLFLAQKLTRTKELTDGIAFMVILVVGVGFGLAHLPQLMSYGAGSQFAIWATILGNLCVSTLYGWCYWRYGLIFAVVAHISLDLVLHFFPAFF